MGTIPVIEIDLPDPQKRGQFYGEAARKTIKKTFGIYKELFGEKSGHTWETILTMLDPYIVKTKVFAPDLIDEVQGIAEGSNLSFKDIFALNARSEIMMDLNIYTDECSSLVALPDSTQDNTTILAQNWDWYKEIESCQVILRINQRGNIPAIVTFTEAGQLSKIGMNGAGIGLAVNNLNTDKSSIGVPWIFKSRRILEARRLTQAMGFLLGTPNAHSMNFLIAHKDGEAVNIETSCVKNHITFPRKNYMAHTNHYTKPCSRLKDIKTEADNPSTFMRLHRMEKLLNIMDGNISIKSIQNILKDHFDQPFSVCLHDSEEFFPAMQKSKTCLSIAFDLSQGKIYYTKGNPCQNKVEHLNFTVSV